MTKNSKPKSKLKIKSKSRIRTGGVQVGRKAKVEIGQGDVTGGDKIEAGGHVIKAGKGAMVVIGSTSPSPAGTAPIADRLTPIGSETPHWQRIAEKVIIERIEQKKQEASKARKDFDFGQALKDANIGLSKRGTTGFARYYQGGVVVWHGAGEHAEKAFAVYGGIWYRAQKFGEDIWEKLGLPITDEEGAADSWFGSKGRYSRFEEGEIVWHDSNNLYWHDLAFAILDPIAKKYDSLGGSGSPLGFPISEPYAIAGGERCDFEGGALVRFGDSGNVQAVRQLLRIDYLDSPFNHNWKQYDGLEDPNCVCVCPGTTIGKSKSFIAFSRSWGSKAIKYPADDTQFLELREKYCGVTVKSLGLGYPMRFYLKVKAKRSDQRLFLEFDTQLHSKKHVFDENENVNYFQTPLPVPLNDGDWHTLVIDLESYVQDGFTKSFELLQDFRFRYDIGIADLLVSESLDVIKAVAEKPVVL